MSDSRHEPWLRGIAFNPAAPSDVLIRLLDQAAGEVGLLMCKGRDLPDAVVDAALRYPAWRIRGALAGNRYVDPARLAPLATDPSGLVRARLASSPYPRPRWVRPLPDDILVTLLTAQDGGEDGKLTENEIIGELESSQQIPLSFYRSMAGREHPELRIRATWRWQTLTPAQRAGLRARWFAGDEVYGGRELRRSARRLGFDYALSVRADHQVTTPGGRFTATTLAARLLRRAWMRMLTGHGLKGDRHYDWTWTDIQSDDAPDTEDEGTSVLVVRRHRFTGELSFYRCHSTRPVTLAGLIHIICTRWRVEEDFQLAKGVTGLDQGQTTCWNGTESRWWMTWEDLRVDQAGGDRPWGTWRRRTRGTATRSKSSPTACGCTSGFRSATARSRN